jgi:hypothetical protein
VLKGDPDRDGLYTIMLRIPAHTRIAAHEHMDDRVATVVSGIWYIGYGDSFNSADLKPLPAGSFYTEPIAPRAFCRDALGSRRRADHRRWTILDALY